MVNVLLHSFLLVLLAFVVTAKQIGDSCFAGPPEDNQGLYVSHPTNCGQYLQCEHGSFIARQCPSGLHWNEEEIACDWPELAECEAAEEFVQRNEVGGACYVGPPEENQGLYVSHPTNCGQYLQCEHGSFIARQCPSGLHWNEEETACDWPDAVNCQQGVVSGVGNYPVPPIQGA